MSIADDIVSAIGKCRITDVINSVLEMDLPSDTTVEQYVTIKKNMANILKRINDTDTLKESGATLTYFKLDGKVVQ